MAYSKEDNNNDNLETFSIWWLDAEVHNDENRKAQNELRSIINDLKTWQHPKEFEECVWRMSHDDRVILILSGRMGREVVPRIHSLRQVSLIYVYCMDKKANEQWARSYSKVKGVFTELRELISQIQSSYKYFIKSEEPLPISFFKVHGTTSKTLTEINGEFLNFQLLIDILSRMKSNKTDRNDFMSMCKKRYEGNMEYLTIAEEFNKSYLSEKALWWYTRETFIYRILNKSLRKKKIDVLVPLHSFISDLHRQLNQHQCDKPIRVYRGQLMSNDELLNCQNSVDHFISINSFFSTSLIKEKALQFCKSSNNDLKGVLFEIDADPRVVASSKRPFANISSFSDIPTEAEILFMVGSIFRLNKIKPNSLQNDGQLITIIRMTLCGEDQNDLHDLYDSIRKEYGKGETDLRSLATLLMKMGKFDLAEKYYCKMLNQLPPKDPALGDLYHSLGCVAAGKGEIDKSLDWYQKSLSIKMQTRPSDYINISESYNGMGIVLQKKGNVNQALEYYNKVVSLFQQAHNENHLYMGAIYHNIGFIYEQQHNYPKALSFYQKSVDIKQKHLHDKHPDFAISYNCMGHVYNCLGDHKNALHFFNLSLEINQKALPCQHPNIACNYKNMGIFYAGRNEFGLALKYLQDARKIYRHSLPPDSPDVVNIDKAIQIVNNKFKII